MSRQWYTVRSASGQETSIRASSADEALRLRRQQYAEGIARRIERGADTDLPFFRWLTATILAAIDGRPETAEAVTAPSAAADDLYPPTPHAVTWDIVRSESEIGATYTRTFVDGKPERCTCKGFTHWNHCKHLAAPSEVRA